MSNAILSDGNSKSSPTIFLHNNRPATTSREVAKFFGKRHDNVIRDISELISNTPESFSALNFEEAEYTDEQGKPRTMFIIYRDGFMLLVMGYTGKEAIQLKLAYIEAFNIMETQITGQSALPPTEKPAIEAAQSALAISIAPAHISIAFAGTTLYLCSHEGEPHVPLRSVVDGMGINWVTQLKKIAKYPEWGCVILQLALYSNRTEDHLCIPLRSLNQYLIGITPQKIKPGMRRRVSTFLRSCHKKLEAAWKAAQTPHRKSSSDISLPLQRLIDAWEEISGLSQKTLEAQVLAAFMAPSISALSEEQTVDALRWVQEKIDAHLARHQQTALPESPQQALAQPPAIPKLDLAVEVDAELRKGAESMSDAYRTHASQMHVKVMKLIDWNAVGMSWFDLASDVIFNMVCQQNCGVGAATRRSLPVAFATELNKLLTELRQHKALARRYEQEGAA